MSQDLSISIRLWLFKSSGALGSSSLPYCRRHRLESLSSSYWRRQRLESLSSSYCRRAELESLSSSYCRRAELESLSSSYCRWARTYRFRFDVDFEFDCSNRQERLGHHLCLTAEDTSWNPYPCPIVGGESWSPYPCPIVGGETRKLGILILVLL